MFLDLYNDNVLVTDSEGNKTTLQDLWEVTIEELGDCEFNYDGRSFSIVEVDSYGGEGMGDELWKVFKVTNRHNVEHFKVYGSYSSYYGSSWDDLTPEKVELRKVTVDQWCRV